MVLGKGAKVNAPGPDGATPLMVASHGGNPSIVKMLLAHGANADARTKKGASALDYAGKNKKIAALLLPHMTNIPGMEAPTVPKPDDLNLPGIPGMPDTTPGKTAQQPNPQNPTMPNIPGMPQIPGQPGFGNNPNPMPGGPQMPSVPTLPTGIQVPGATGIPRLPGQP